MIWKSDRNHRRGGRWRCPFNDTHKRDRRIVNLFGFVYRAPDMASKEYALQLREERKNASQTS